VIGVEGALDPESPEGFIMKSKTSFWVVLGIGLALAGATACGDSTPPPATPDSKAAPADPTKDTDGDGVPDQTDKCPDQKEDGQGPDPKDGCPKKP
jgi:hypothetical protein